MKSGPFKDAQWAFSRQLDALVDGEAQHEDALDAVEQLLVEAMGTLEQSQAEKPVIAAHEAMVAARGRGSALIAAAPDLLAACEAALASCTGEDARQADREQVAIQAMLRAAVKKARGAQPAVVSRRCVHCGRQEPGGWIKIATGWRCADEHGCAERSRGW